MKKYFQDRVGLSPTNDLLGYIALQGWNLFELIWLYFTGADRQVFNVNLDRPKYLVSTLVVRLQLMTCEQ